MSLCLCTSALHFYVCDLPHCVSGVCGHMNHLLCPKQASVQAQRQQPQCQCGGHQLPCASGSPPPKSQALGIRITGEVAHVWDIQVLLEQHWPKKSANVSTVTLLVSCIFLDPVFPTLLSSPFSSVFP